MLWLERYLQRTVHSRLVNSLKLRKRSQPSSPNASGRLSGYFSTKTSIGSWV
jgi:hypothetical protein